MTEIICINAKFDNDQLEFWSKFGVVTPEQDKMYTIRDVIVNSIGKTGLLLVEVVNPKLPIKHPVMGTVIEMEPNFSEDRFRTLSGDKLNMSEIKEEIKIKQYESNRNLG